MYEDIPDSLSTPGAFHVAGHNFSRKNFRCMKCQRSIDDVLSDAPAMKVGAPGVSCWGTLSLHEQESLLKAYESRSKAIVSANKVRA